MDNEKFGKFFVELRKEKNMTQQEIANKFNVTNKAVSKWERGLSFPDISMLKPISEFFGVTILELLNGERNRNKDIDIDTRVLTILKQVENEKNKKIRKVILKTIIFVIFTLLIYTSLFFSKSELHTYNPIRAFIGYIRVSEFNEQYVEVGNIPNKTIYANSDFNIEKYMNDLGYKKLEGLATKAGIDDFYTNGEIKVLVSRYSRKGIAIYEFENETPYHEEKNLIIPQINLDINSQANNIINIPVFNIVESNNNVNNI